MRNVSGIFSLIVPSVLLAACGGGGGGSTPSVVMPTPVVPTTITGTAAPPVAPTNGNIYPDPNMLIGPSSLGQWGAVVQGMDYTFDPAAATATPATFKVVTLTVKPVDTGSNSFYIQTGPAYPTDSTLGQVTYIMNQIGSYAYPIGISTGAVASQNTSLGGLPTSMLTNTSTAAIAGYVLPYSATLNPAGYTYQTFGSWIYTNMATAVFSEYYFSAGVQTALGTLPTVGTASYTGYVAGSYVDAATRDLGDVQATMGATVDFSARTVAFSTTSTTTLSANVAAGTSRTANAALDMSGTLSYATGSNTFTGAVSTANGMTGNATGRFYGPGIATATATKVAGSPPEIGGTFAVMNSSGAMQGAFGGN